MKFESTKVISLGSTAFRQWRANHSHCSKIHGYRLKAKLWLTADTLDDKNWVYDFGGFKELKKIFDQQFDHTFCAAADDPSLETFKTLHQQGVIDLRVMEKGVGIERTAEWVFNKTQEYLQLVTNGRVSVEKVEVWEHEDNSAICSKVSQPSVVSGPQITSEVRVSTTEPIVVTEPVVEAATVPEPVVETHSPGAAHVGSNVSQGKGNWFAGTSWG